MSGSFLGPEGLDTNEIDSVSSGCLLPSEGRQTISRCVCKITS